LNGIDLEVWFPQQDEVTVFLESSITDGEEERLYETMLFALFAARQIANGRGDASSVSLADVLFEIDAHLPLADVESRLLGEVRVGSPTSRGGRRGFTAEFRPEKRGFFKLHMHGFGVLGKGVGYYAPASTLALLCWMLRRREDDDVYQRALGMAAKGVGAAGVSGMISVTSQAQIAMQAAGAAWMQPPDLLPDGYELSPEAAAAADGSGIDFGELYTGARARLEEAVAEIEPSDGVMIILPDEISLRTCRAEVAYAADLVSEGSPLHRALEATIAADATGDEQTMSSASAHYDSELAKALDANGLTPLVGELKGLLFTSERDEAAEF
jgi:hypothetical protein